MYVEMLDFEFIFLEIISIQIQNLWYLSVMLHVLVRTMSSKAFGSFILG
jgi:type IV secretory pathway VirB3-like protein